MVLTFATGLMGAGGEGPTQPGWNPPASTDRLLQLCLLLRLWGTQVS